MVAQNIPFSGRRMATLPLNLQDELPTLRSVVHFSAQRGCSSVVERHVANVNVEGSNPFTRFQPLIRTLVSRQAVRSEQPRFTAGFVVG